MSIAVPSFTEVKDNVVALARDVAANPKAAAQAVAKEASKPNFIVGVCVGIASAIAIKNMVS